MSREAGAIHYHETAERVELDVLDTLCAYFDCQVSDIFEFNPNLVPKGENTSP
ncbi:helix-turn-helix domain-containing protein [Vogesella indigofera]|uniref:helix-turn-helix domain-containing protein n=1 Tax=Vogesella indigofera TaxID=45465 RepID=UPI003F421B51